MVLSLKRGDAHKKYAWCKNYVHNTLKYNKLYLKFLLDEGPYIKHVGWAAGGFLWGP